MRDLLKAIGVVFLVSFSAILFITILVFLSPVLCHYLKLWEMYWK